MIDKVNINADTVYNLEMAKGVSVSPADQKAILEFIIARFVNSTANVLRDDIPKILTMYRRSNIENIPINRFPTIYSKFLYRPGNEYGENKDLIDRYLMIVVNTESIKEQASKVAVTVMASAAFDVGIFVGLMGDNQTRAELHALHDQLISVAQDMNVRKFGQANFAFELPRSERREDGASKELAKADQEIQHLANWLTSGRAEGEWEMDAMRKLAYAESKKSECLRELKNVHARRASLQRLLSKPAADEKLLQALRATRM